MSKKMRNNSLLIIGIFIFFLIIIIGSLFVRTTGFADNIFQSKEDSKLSDSKTTEDLVKLDSNPEEIKVQEAPEIDSEKVEGEPEPAEKAVEQDQPKIDKKELAKQKQLLELSSKDNIAIEYNYERPVISKDSGNKDIIIISKLSNLNIPGEPEIPFEVAMIMLPADKDIDKVTVIPDEKIEIKGNYDIKKGDWQFPLSEFDNPDEISKQVEELEKNKTIFKKYPVNYYSNPSLQVKKGYKFVIFNLYPVEYLQKEQRLSYYPKFTVVVTLKDGKIPQSFRSDNPEDQREIYDWVISQNSNLSAEKDLTYEKYQEISKAVANKTNLSALYTYTGESKQATDNRNQPNIPDTYSYKYIIVTKREFGQAFQPLITWKTTRSNNPITAKIFYMEDILADPRFSCTGEYNWGDGCGQYNQFDDNAARLRNFIRFAYTTYNTEYVLLGGDADYQNLGPGTETEDVIVPSRYIGAAGYDPENPYWLNPIIVSDMYFTNLEGSFNQENDGVFRFHYNEVDNDGNPIENTDYLPEVAIGRAPFDNTTEITNWINKVIANEQITNYNNLNYLFVGEFLGFGGVANFAGPAMDEIITGSTTFGINTVGFSSVNQDNIYRLYDNYQNYNPPQTEGFSTQDLIDLMNSVNPYVINHLGHGNVNFLMKFQVYGPTEEIAGLTAQRSFINSQACYSGAFDNLSTSSTMDRDSISEYMLSLENGPFSMITNSRFGWGNMYSLTGPSQIMQRHFWNNAFTNQNKNLGKLNNLSKEDYLINGGWSFVYLETNLLGDPETALKLPTTDNSLSISLSEGIINSTYYQNDYGININLTNLTDTTQPSTLHIYLDDQEISNQIISLVPGDNFVNYVINHNLYSEEIGFYKTIKVAVDSVNSEETYDNTAETQLFIYNAQFNSDQTINLENQIIDCNTVAGQTIFGVDTNKVALHYTLFIEGTGITLKNCEFIGDVSYDAKLVFVTTSNLILERNTFKQIDVIINNANSIIVRNNKVFTNYFSNNNYGIGQDFWSYNVINGANIYDNNLLSFRDITLTNIGFDGGTINFESSYGVNIYNNNFKDVFGAIYLSESEDINISNNKFYLTKFPVAFGGANTNVMSIKTNNSNTVQIINNKIDNMPVDLRNTNNIDFNYNNLKNSAVYSDETCDNVIINGNIIQNRDCGYFGGVWVGSVVGLMNNKVCVYSTFNPGPAIFLLDTINCNDMNELIVNFHGNLINSLLGGSLESDCPELLPQHGVNYCYCNEKFAPDGTGCVPDDISQEVNDVPLHD